MNKLIKSFSKAILYIIIFCVMDLTYAQVIKYTQISLNSNGEFVALGYVNKDNNEVVDIVKLSGMPNLKAQQLLLGKLQAFTIAFGLHPESLLITTRNKNGSDLLRVNVVDTRNPKIDKLYSHPISLRFPKELEGNKIIFLEQIDEKSGGSVWRIFDGTMTYNTIAQIFRRAAWPNVVAGNVFLPIPIKGKGIVDIVGKTPNVIREFYDTSDGFMVCANINEPIICLKNEVTILMTESFGEFIINKGGRICRVPGQWKESHPFEISGNGKFVVFQGIPRGESKRGLYLIEINDRDCRPQPINIIREK